jgi:hypothetical protein
MGGVAVEGSPPVRNGVGSRLPVLSWIGTSVFTVTAVAAVFASTLEAVAAGTALVLFAVGTAAFLWAYAIAIGRSRTDAIGIGGLYFLAGDVAPAAVRRSMMFSLGVETVVALATASARPFTSLAFGILVPVYGLGLAGLWGARYGTFTARAPK